MAIDLATGFNIGSKDAIDERQVLTLEQMKNLDESIYPDKYFAICKDDSMLYVYNVNNPVDAETGKFRKVGSNESVDPSIFQKINDDTLTTDDKTIPGALNELVIKKLNSPEVAGNENDVLTLTADGTLVWAPIPDVDLSGKLDKPEIEGTAGQILVLQDDGSLAYQDNVTEYDDTELRELIDTKINKPEIEGTPGQILVLQDDGTLAYQDNISEFDDTELQEAVANKLDKPEVDGTSGQILVLQDDGSLAYADNVTEFDDTEIQEELDTKLDKEKVVQNLDAPDAESVLSTEALNTVLNNKLDRSDGSSLVPDTEIAKIHEHANQDVLDKLSDDGNGKLLYDSNPISVDEMTVIELNDFLDTLEINAVGYVPPTTP